MFVVIALPAPGLAQTFALVIAGLCRATASRIAVDRFAGPLLVRIFIRLHRLSARLTSLVTQIQAGKLPQPRPSRRTASRHYPRKPRLPESRGWLLRVVPATAEYAGQVQAMLDDPQTAALLEIAPQAGRILRPLCRMLAIPLPDHLRRPKPTPAPQPAAADPPAESPPAPPLPAACVTPHQAIATGPPPSRASPWNHSDRVGCACAARPARKQQARVLCDEDVASHIGPEPCAVSR
jgi:hypothetical protein